MDNSLLEVAKTVSEVVMEVREMKSPYMSMGKSLREVEYVSVGEMIREAC